MNERDDVWEPLTPREIARIMAPATFPWWIAGGHAIDHAVGRQVRSHADIDVLILRADHVAARTLLSDWDCWAADPPSPKSCSNTRRGLLCVGSGVVGDAHASVVP